MNLTGKHYRAIGLYSKQNNLRLSLSVPPLIDFDSDDGIVSVPIERIMGHYEQHMKQATKERARKAHHARSR